MEVTSSATSGNYNASVLRIASIGNTTYNRIYGADKFGLIFNLDNEGQLTLNRGSLSILGTGNAGGGERADVRHRLAKRKGEGIDNIPGVFILGGDGEGCIGIGDDEAARAVREPNTVCCADDD
jgi:hypothetical protein